jgi:hypothetical protein
MISSHNIAALLASERGAALHREAQALSVSAPRRQSAQAESSVARIICQSLGRRSTNRAVSPEGYGCSVEPLEGLGDGSDRAPGRPKSNPGSPSRLKLGRVVARRRVYVPITARGVARLGDYYGEGGRR